MNGKHTDTQLLILSHSMPSTCVRSRHAHSTPLNELEIKKNQTGQMPMQRWKTREVTTKFKRTLTSSMGLENAVGSSVVRDKH